MVHFLRVFAVIINLLFFQNLYSQEKKYTFNIQSQYSTFENEFSEKSKSRIVYLSNNHNDNFLWFMVKNDTVQNITISDKALNRVYFSKERLVLNSDFQNRIASLKFDLFQFNFPKKENDNIEISINYSKTENIINIREFNNKKRKNKGIKNDLYLKTIKNPKFINTQNFTIGMITHHRIWHAEPISDEIISESYYLKDNIKTDIYKLDNIEETNFEINIK